MEITFNQIQISCPMLTLLWILVPIALSNDVEELYFFMNKASAYGGASASTHSQVGESRYKPESASTEPTHLECPLCLNVQVASFTSTL